MNIRIDTNQRLHGIDTLRGIAMILGILLHATIPYKVVALPTWPHDEKFNHWIFDFVYFLIHSFRMPLFFLIAGYFCRFLYYRIGEKAFINHRWKRIGIPFLISLVTVLPFTIFPFLVSDFKHKYPGDWNAVFHSSFRQLLRWNGLAHLWFLYYLIIYYLVVIVFFRIYRIPSLQRIIRRALTFLNIFNPYYTFGILLAALPVWLLLLMVPELFFHVDTGIIPGLPYILFYAWFFIIGWVINKNPTAFNRLGQRSWILITLGMAISILVFISDFTGWLGKTGESVLILAKGFLAIQACLLVYGIIGFFLRYFQAENRFWKYISDASYWMYLIHLGLIAGIQVSFIDSPLPGFYRFPILLILTLTITLVTYHFWVRYTIIGTYLHGPRKRK